MLASVNVNVINIYQFRNQYVYISPAPARDLECIPSPVAPRRRSMRTSLRPGPRSNRWKKRTRSRFGLVWVEISRTRSRLGLLFSVHSHTQSRVAHGSPTTPSPSITKRVRVKHPRSNTVIHCSHNFLKIDLTLMSRMS